MSGKTIAAVVTAAVVVAVGAALFAQQRPVTGPDGSAGGVACPAATAPPTAVGEIPPAPRLPLLGDTAPAFSAQSTQGPVNFPEDYRDKWVILFSHPADFTPVCTTEFMAFATMEPQFNQLGCKLIGLSVDSNFSHIAWLRTIRGVQYKDMKNVDVTFPLLEDVRMDVARKYGMIQPNASTTQAVRAVFIIDPAQKIRAFLYYPLTTGRNVDEILRLLIALQTSDRHKVSTPVNWTPGDDVIVPPPNSCGQSDLRVQNPPPGDRVVTWFLTFRPMPRQKLSLPQPAE